MPAFDLNERASGLLLHITSLPGPHGSGDLGPEAHSFVRQMAAAGQRWWLVLPIGPVGYGNSPYSALSMFAGNPMFISPDALVRDRLLPSSAVRRAPTFPPGRVSYAAASRHRGRLLAAAFARFEAWPRSHALRRAEAAFAERERRWLDDFALYAALKDRQGLKPWIEWPAGVRDRRAPALRAASRELRAEIAAQRFQQWLFDHQWRALRDAAHRQGVGLIGDAPIFAAHDSADVWTHRELFHLDARGRSTVVAGVPPDYFSRTGQLWGNPLYRWDRLARSGFGWWVDRMRHLLDRFDAVRLDHFIGFQRYWEIPANAPTAVRGRWRPGPGARLFERLRRSVEALPFIAEDLGVTGPEVKRLRDRYGFPGIRILQFAFGNDPSAPDFLPHNYPRRAVVFTGTHDNDTTAGWFHDRGGGASTRSTAQTEKERRVARAYLGSDGREIHWDMIRMASLSVADIAIFPVQDILGLGSEARMNRPGTSTGNWEWRLRRSQLSGDLWKRLAEITRTYERWPAR